MTEEHLAQLGTLMGTFAIVIVQAVFGHRKGKRADATRRDEMKSGFKELRQTIDSNQKATDGRLEQLGEKIKEVKHFVVGPDGENGIRGDVREIKDELKGVLTRERERLEAKAYGR